MRSAATLLGFRRGIAAFGILPAGPYIARETKGNEAGESRALRMRAADLLFDLSVEPGDGALPTRGRFCRPRT
jgi:hypothetical protein